MALLDILANNTDRKSGHVLLIPDRDGEPASVWGIDNVFVLRRRLKLRTVIWEFGDEPIGDELLVGVGSLCERCRSRSLRCWPTTQVEALQGRAAWCVDAPTLPDRPQWS